MEVKITKEEFLAKACVKLEDAGTMKSLKMTRLYSPATAGAEPRKVVTAACLEEYFERVVKLNSEFPETWHLLMQAEDRCRSEMFERYRRQLVKAAVDGKLPMGLEFDPVTPWVGVFTHAARDTMYWDEHVVRPAQNFIARGGKQMTMDKAAKATIPETAREILDGVNMSANSPPGMGVDSDVGDFLPQLTWLTLTNNYLSHCPNSLGQLKNLAKLYLEGNQLSELPESIGDLAALQVLQLDRNQFQNLPSVCLGLKLLG
eukprot:g19829.t1